MRVRSRAATVVFLVALTSSACADDDADAGRATSVTTGPAVTSSVTSAAATSAAPTSPAAPTSSSEAPTSTVDPVAEQARFDAALVALGIDRAGAPAEAVELRGAVFCGMDDATLGHGEPVLDVAGRRCFLDVRVAGGAAVFVTLMSTNEGDPMAFIFRAEDRAVTVWIDRTRDPLGSGGWDGGPCGDFTVGTVASDDTTPVFACLGGDASP